MAMLERAAICTESSKEGGAMCTEGSKEEGRTAPLRSPYDPLPHQILNTVPKAGKEQDRAKACATPMSSICAPDYRTESALDLVFA